MDAVDAGRGLDNLLKDGSIDDVIIKVTSCHDTSDSQFVRDIPLKDIQSITIINQ